MGDLSCIFFGTKSSACKSKCIHLKTNQGNGNELSRFYMPRYNGSTVWYPYFSSECLTSCLLYQERHWENFIQHTAIEKRETYTSFHNVIQLEKVSV